MNDTAAPLIGRLLAAVEAHWGGDGVIVDKTTGNAARISKVYGTLAAKGDATAARPHRIARILDAPPAVIPAPRAALEALAALAPDVPSAGRKATATYREFDIDAFIIRNLGNTAAPPKPWKGGRRWVLSPCPFNPAHETGSAVLQQASGAFSFRCQHNGCRGRSWSDLRRLFEPGDTRAGRAHEAQSAHELLAQEFPPIKWIIPDILPEGCTVFASKPKMGKTWVGLGIAISVAAGGFALGRYRVEDGEVLYLALEDGDRSLQSRLKRLKGDSDVWTHRLDYQTSWRRVDDGGLDDLGAWIEAHSRARLIVIDTLKRVRAPRRPNRSLYDEDYEALSGLADLAHKYNVGILVLYHLRKMPGGDDPYDEISGSTGLTAAPDTLMVLRRTRGESEAALHITGRDVPDVGFALKFDAVTATWCVTGDLDEQRRSKARRELLEVLAAGPESGMKPADLANALEKPGGTVRKLLFDMKRDGDVLEERGLYRVSVRYHRPDNTPSSADTGQESQRYRVTDEGAIAAVPAEEGLVERDKPVTLAPNSVSSAVRSGEPRHLIGYGGERAYESAETSSNQMDASEEIGDLNPESLVGTHPPHNGNGQAGLIRPCSVCVTQTLHREDTAGRWVCSTCHPLVTGDPSEPKKGTEVSPSVSENLPPQWVDPRSEYSPDEWASICAQSPPDTGIDGTVVAKADAAVRGNGDAIIYPSVCISCGKATRYPTEDGWTCRYCDAVAQ
jgi:ribosomal protein L37AE/L43A